MYYYIRKILLFCTQSALQYAIGCLPSGASIFL